ncbi:hypothetical protein PSM36_2869 [Proteiniphilum saccharofermentans]|uniref:Uncharacterized protein n=1 Tax=Proteiniphilum saccharofermentans TaxID=1642647 RepID=A0A1R3TDG8_9BACT|nr:hypothetical protein PSM36_2869 [Proteiniphilum saccharofermentans]SEA35299.1 hypothetical protein SAMN05216331_1379 [Porphyromonadaceae bacterium KH3R12]SFK25335.1 hypothetical protein SAMN05216357_10112 [Porphyromonadaceae bacterium KH3CP3RA]SFS52098.1 hypothetical protein SAMN05216365_11014 [Porphyromonadaceae bacterium NLAE-zl-C104]
MIVLLIFLYQKYTNDTVLNSTFILNDRNSLQK